jgi:hypothetical protein
MDLLKLGKFSKELKEEILPLLGAFIKDNILRIKESLHELIDRFEVEIVIKSRPRKEQQ